jgi:hypothetical protein
MARWEFETVLSRPPGVGTWTLALVPPAIAEETGIRARVRVKGTIDGVPFRCSLLPAGGGRHFVVVNREIRDRIGKVAGASVKVLMDVDTAPVVVAIPSDFAKALRGNKRAQKAFENMAPSHRKAYVQWIEGAKMPETRARRLKKALGMIAENQFL